MLRTRLWMGALLIALAAGVLAFDPAPWFPILLVMMTLLSVAACYELQLLLGPGRRPTTWFCVAGVVAVVLANWPAHLWGWGEPWRPVLYTFAAVVLAAFLLEMATFREPGQSVVRIALAVWAVAYLGLLRTAPSVGTGAAAADVVLPGGDGGRGAGQLAGPPVGLG